MDVFCVGDVNVDIITKPLSGLGEKEQVETDIIVTKGGEAFNFAYSAARFGLKAAFAGKVGNDIFGEFLGKKAKEFGFEPVFARGRKTAMTFALTQKDRKFITDSAANHHLKYGEIPKKFLNI